NTPDQCHAPPRESHPHTAVTRYPLTGKKKEKEEKEGEFVSFAIRLGSKRGYFTYYSVLWERTAADTFAHVIVTTFVLPKSHLGHDDVTVIKVINRSQSVGLHRKYRRKALLREERCFFFVYI
ncbi:hypothetical protein, partial [Porphyromonas loveana]|uniref:hypothetical protein n=1 Tax=Porphyromonas loveana TaxID=1884669 RepID=UPI0035A0BC8C